MPFVPIPPALAPARVVYTIPTTTNMDVDEVRARIRATLAPTWTAERCMRALGIRLYRPETIMGAKIRGAIRRGFRRAH